MKKKNGSAKPVRGSGETQKKLKAEKEEIKLPSLSSLSPSKKVKDVRMPGSKPAPVLIGGTKVLKTITPKSPSKPFTARNIPTKLSAPLKAEPSQSSEHLAEEEESNFPEPEKLSLELADLSIDDIAVAKAAAEEAERLRQLNGNGMVKLIYEQYDELFPIEDGSTTQATIDEIYCLSFVMPNCLVRLSRHPNIERFQREEVGTFDSLVREDPRGTYHGLEMDQTYYVVVEQETDQLRRDQDTTKALWTGELQKQKKEDKNDGRGVETCSCIYGNPCVDEYGCRDWHTRFAVATKNGWKGF